jgi:sigma-B regulation protein RsbU (phosphoserine phosphatase)
VDLAPGDTLVIFSDGITEAGITDGEDFGDRRVLALAGERRGAPARELVDCLIDEARRFSPDSQADDMTVVAASAR